MPQLNRRASVPDRSRRQGIHSPNLNQYEGVSGTLILPMRNRNGCSLIDNLDQCKNNEQPDTNTSKSDIHESVFSENSSDSEDQDTVYEDAISEFSATSSSKRNSIDSCLPELPYFDVPFDQWSIMLETGEIQQSHQDDPEDMNQPGSSNSIQVAKVLQRCAGAAEGLTLPAEFIDDMDDWDDSDSHHDEHYECQICYCSYSREDILYCDECETMSCLDCMSLHFVAKIRQGDVRVTCLGHGCLRVLSEQMVAAFAPDLMPLFRKNQIEIENNPLKKTCPSCHKVEKVNNKNETMVQCADCSLQWCFSCHAPWHKGITCKMFMQDVEGRGKKALKYWAKSKGKENPNARKCPKCQFFIERISGCDHMTCARCKTEFCFKCGEKYRSAGFLGNHYSRFSPLGCKYNLKPSKPVLRIAIRSAVFTGGVVGAPIAGCLILGAGALVIACFPCWLPCVVYKCRR